MNWLKEKGWFENLNRNFELFYEELMKLLKNQIITETETEFLNQLRKNALIVVDPLDDDVLVKWSMAFKSIERMFSKELRDSVKVESIIRDQIEGWRRIRDTHPSMAYLFDEFTNRRHDKTIESVSDFVQLVFDIIRSMQRACEIAVKLGYTCAPKQSGKINVKSIHAKSM